MSLPQLQPDEAVLKQPHQPSSIRERSPDSHDVETNEPDVAEVERIYRYDL